MQHFTWQQKAFRLIPGGFLFGKQDTSTAYLLQLK
jgi:hypothetical protein